MPRQVEAQRQAGRQEEAPFALTLQEGGTQRLYALNEAAAALGLARFMPLADAKARLPALAHEPADPAGDDAALHRLAAWCLRYSPFVSADPMAAGGEDGLLIDASGCAHLFGGEEAMLARIEKDFAKAGFTARTGLAETLGAAHALARFGANERPRRIAPPGRLRESLEPLPVEALRLDEKTVLLLRRLGLERIGALYALPRRALARRFRSKAAGEAVLLRLDQALGHEGESLSPLHPAPAFRVSAGFAEPVTEEDFLPEIFRRLAEDLKPLLEREGEGGTRWCLRALRLDGGAASFTFRTAAPVRDGAHLVRLFRERLGQPDHGFDLGPGAEHFILSAEETAPFDAAQSAFAGREHEKGEETARLAALADRLMARFGETRVKRQDPCPSHIPERAASVKGFSHEVRGGAAWQTPRDSVPSNRPVRLLTRPEPIEVMAEVPDGPPLRFRFRKAMHQVARAEGPERIAPEWWRLESGVFEEIRDYYRIEDVSGRRYWVFRAGLYEGPQAGEQPPSWFMHGFFA